MQATGTLQEARFSKGFILVVVAMLCALLLGAAGGYVMRGAGSAAGAPAVTRPAVDLNGNGPDSDLTRALPNAAPAGHAVPAVPDHGLIP